MTTEKLKNSIRKCFLIGDDDKKIEELYSQMSSKREGAQNGVLATENCLNFVLLAMIGTGILNFRLSEDTKNH